MTPPGTIKSLALMLKTDGIRLKNLFRNNPKRTVLSALTILFLTVLFIGIEFQVAKQLFQHIMNQVHLETLRYVLLAKLLQMVFIVFGILLIYSNIVLSISSYFTSPEIEMIHPRPVSETAIFIYRFLETILRSSWMFIAFGIPILYAYGTVMMPDSAFFLQIPIIIFPALLIPAAIGVPIGILLILAFSPRRTQQVFLVMGLFLAVGLVLVFRFMQPEQLVDPIGVEQVNFYLETLRIPSVNWLPSTWASEGMAAYGENRLTINRLFGVKLWGTSLVSMLLAFLCFKLFWWKARSGGRGAEVVDEGINPKSIRQVKPSAFRSSLTYRDMILFSRDPGQWSQIIVIAALIIIYVYNFKNLPYELYGFQNWMAFVSVGASGLILSALLARFGFPAVSTEGKAIWVLKTGPVNWRRYLWHKYLFLLIPTALIGLTLVIFSVRVLDVNSVLMFKCILAELIIASGCTGLAVGFGAIRPRFDIQEAAMVAVSTAGLWYMLSALAFICFTLAMVILPDAVRYLSYGFKFFKFIHNADRVIVWIVLLLVNLAVVIVPMELGIKKLNLVEK